jgi:hypothetical protein
MARQPHLYTVPDRGDLASVDYISFRRTVTNYMWEQLRLRSKIRVAVRMGRSISMLTTER